MKIVFYGLTTLFCSFTLTGCFSEIETGQVRVSEVILDKTTLSLTTGSKEILTATLLPTNADNRKVSWTSNHTEVATVNSDGWVTGVSEGDAIVIVTTDDGNKTATAQVSVIPITRNVTGVTLNPNALQLLIGDSEKLTAAIQPANATNQNVMWSCSNTKVATVNSNGLVTALSEGFATITVKTEQGNKTATCNTTVTPAKGFLSGLLLNVHTLNLVIGESEKLIAFMQPNHTTNNPFLWSSNNPDVAMVDSHGLVTAVSDGYATITVYTDEGEETSCDVIVTLFSGSGEVSRPYMIGTAAQLAKLADLVNHSDTHDRWFNKNYRLSANINLSTWLSKDHAGYNGGYGWIPIGNGNFPFSGDFDGDQFTISELYINDPTLNDVGLFGSVFNGTIKNICVETSTSGIYANTNVGVCVGGVNGHSNVMNCITSGKVSGVLHIGGVVGSAKGIIGDAVSSVNHCYSTAVVGAAIAEGPGYVGGVVGWIYFGSAVNCGATGTVSGSGVVGGIVGLASNSRVINCYAKGMVFGVTTDIGGVAGSLFYSSIINCYATGNVEGAEIVGGLVGLVNFSSVTNCYATGTVSGAFYIGGVVGWVPNGSVTNCVALNQYIVRTEDTHTFFGRVAGGSINGELSQNVAWSGMLTYNVSFPSGKGADHINGADISSAQAKTAAFWKTSTSTWTGRDTHVWDMVDNRLPILRDVGGSQSEDNPPPHLL